MASPHNENFESKKPELEKDVIDVGEKLLSDAQGVSKGPKLDLSIEDPKYHDLFNAVLQDGNFNSIGQERAAQLMQQRIEDQTKNLKDWSPEQIFAAMGNNSVLMTSLMKRNQAILTQTKELQFSQMA
ncbi:MAG: hypothetical protein J0H83_17415 [Candidatus Melainabacteria bacterium]|jgi:hypothetical protein|nr:hypothetical protein [Candidatus Melainabacteria bacterium]MBX9673636.1 hypothetical protein [Candidatus Obscuribacterales bacterium]